MLRLFVSVDLPDALKDELEFLCHGVEGARWTNERQFHVTLAFLGEVSGPVARAVQEALKRVRGDPFELQLQGVGHFPPRGAPKVLWVGLEPSEELAQLHDRVRSALLRAGVAAERRRFAPHVTLARLRRAPLPGVVDFLTSHGAFRPEPFAVTDFQLMRSVLGRSGAQHTVQISYPLFERRA